MPLMRITSYKAVKDRKLSFRNTMDHAQIVSTIAIRHPRQQFVRNVCHSYRSQRKILGEACNQNSLLEGMHHIGDRPCFLSGALLINRGWQKKQKQTCWNAYFRFKST